MTEIKKAAARIPPAWILLAAWLVCLAYAFPGYMNFDADYQLHEVRSGVYTDWFPPIMEVCWRVIELVIRGPAGMLMLQTSLFLWGLYALFLQRFCPRTAALLAAAVLLFPPVLTPMAVVWKDAQMAGFLLAGTMLAIRPSRRARALGIFLLFLGTGVRYNAPAALPFISLFVVHAWQLRSRWVTVIVALAIFGSLSGGTAVVNHRLVHRTMYPWYRSLALTDIAGTICDSDEMPDAEVREVLDGMHVSATDHLQAAMCKVYSPREWPGLGVDAHPFFVDWPDDGERAGRDHAWWALVQEHPGAYLTHRWAVMREVLGLTDAEPWEPVCQDFVRDPGTIRHDASLSWFQRRLGTAFRALAHTMLFRPWAYLVVGMLLFGYALIRRDRLVVALMGSGLLYESSYFFGAANPDFRYSHWMVTCCCVSAILVFVERLRARRVHPGDARAIP